MSDDLHHLISLLAIAVILPAVALLIVSCRRMSRATREMEQLVWRFGELTAAEGQLVVAGKTGDVEMARNALARISLIREL